MYEKKLISKITEQFNGLFNWLKEIRLKRKVGKRRTKLRFKEEKRRN